MTITVEIDNNSVVVKHKGASKPISPLDYLNVVRNVLDSATDEVSMDNGFILPSHCIYMKQNKTTVAIMMLIPERIVDFPFDTRSGKPTIYTIPVPPVLISVILKKESEGSFSVESAKFFTTDLPVVSLCKKGFINSSNRSEHIWVLPMPNIFGDGKPCYGSNTPALKLNDNNLRGLDWFYTFLTTAPGNNDLTINHCPSGLNSHPLTYIQDLSKLKSFPLKDLPK